MMMTKSDFDALSVKRFVFNNINCLIQKVDLGAPNLARMAMGDLSFAHIHLCGYVGLPEGHPFYKVEYSDKLPFTMTEAVGEDEPVGDRGIIPLVCRAGGMDSRATLDALINVHGSITYSGMCPWRDGEVGKDLWWVGFDCAHYQDTYERCNEAYVEGQIKQLLWELEKYSKIMLATKDRPQLTEEDEDDEPEISLEEVITDEASDLDP